MLKNIFQIAKKELGAFFSSPVAFIFLGGFLLVNLFVFFWVESFFARNIADVRPLFEWMPLLMVFLVAALTMRMWSEERRMGTLEFLLTLPVKTSELVLGKFLACLLLVGIALLLTVPVPISVGMIEHVDLDIGPIVGAYIASIFLAGAYAAIGVFVSSKSDNQIVSLIGTTFICLLLYMIGSSEMTSLFGQTGSEIAKLLGSGSRFESITRGVIDFRDIYYYLSIIGIFLSLNVLTLEKLKWSEGVSNAHHKRWGALTALLALNLLAGNFWLYQVNSLRADITQNKVYSISDATRLYVEQLQEPMIIRGYFSSKTHPLLAPFIPQLKDLIKEYGIASNGNIRAEFIDPLQNPELEEEANRKYNIKPIPFQISDKYQASLVNSYFDILVQYGDKYEVLSFRDLIEIKMGGETDIDVELRNPEYDITRSIKKVLYGFQSIDSLFDAMNRPVRFTAYISAEAKLPEKLRNFRTDLLEVVGEMKSAAGDKLIFNEVDPQADGGQVAKDIAEKYGFRPMATSLSLVNSATFYFYMTLDDGQQIIQIPLPEGLEKESARRTIEAGLKRFSAGFLKTIGLVLPHTPPANPLMPGMQGGKSFRSLEQKLQQNYTIKNVTLDKGLVAEDIDLLMVVAPENFSPLQMFAVDQFLMKGGTVVLATGARSVKRGNSAVTASSHTSGLEPWLKHYGIEIEDKMLLDTQYQLYPVPVRRNLGGLAVEEIHTVPYPPWVDIRKDGLNEEVGITSGLPQVTLNWPSPVFVDLDKNKTRKVVELLKSSEGSWASDSVTVQPDYKMFPPHGFALDGKQQRHTLGVLVEGSFRSYFEGKDSPLADVQQQAEQSGPQGEEAEEAAPVFSSKIDQSPETSRIIIYGSNEFLADDTIHIASATSGTEQVNSIRLIENTLDWSLEDRGLLSIRNRGHFSQSLPAIEKTEKLFWEYANYAMAFLGLFLTFLFHRALVSKTKAHYTEILEGAA